MLPLARQDGAMCWHRESHVVRETRFPLLCLFSAICDKNVIPKEPNTSRSLFPWQHGTLYLLQPNFPLTNHGPAKMKMVAHSLAIVATVMTMLFVRMGWEKGIFMVTAVWLVGMRIGGICEDRVEVGGVQMLNRLDTQLERKQHQTWCEFFAAKCVD